MKPVSGAMLVLVLCGWIASPVMAGKIGDPAAPLSVTKWVKGEPVDLAACKGKNVVVVEFWATWCGPCIASMPHLTELQKKYEKDGLIVIGVTSPDPNNAIETVESFVKEKGDGMGYRVAFDGDLKTDAAYMKAFGKGGIPQSFVIDRAGNIAWEGHPMELDKVLEEQMILGAKYDPATYKKVVQIRELKSKYFALAVSPSNKGTVRALGKQVIQQGAAVPDMLTEFASEILDKKDLKVRELDQAVEASRKAVEATKGQDAAALAVHAQALFATDKVAEAVEHQKKALAACKDEALKAKLTQGLQTYQVAQGGK